jgi:hypothetical protein
MTVRRSLTVTVLAMVAAVFVAALPATASAASGRSVRHVSKRVFLRAQPRAVGASAPSLVFGIYPGGAAGTVGPSGPIRPENPTARLAALQRLRTPGRPFVLHLYVSYTGPGSASAAAQLGSQIASYEANGFQVELALCYRPADQNASVDVAGFAAFARQAVADLGSNPSFVGLQVTNEANVHGAPNASDGYYPGASDALIKGVESAKTAARSLGSNVQVGFNWAYQTGSAEKSFWSYLGKRGGSAFLGSLDWVGIDAYPGTWGPPLATGLDLASAVRKSMNDALNVLRNGYMPLAHVGAGVPIHFSENGYPTGPGRSFDAQKTVLEAAVQAASDFRGTYNVSDYRWFDLRDNNSASTSFEDQYGLMTDQYAAKPAFDAYRTLISAL